MTDDNEKQHYSIRLPTELDLPSAVRTDLRSFGADIKPPLRMLSESPGRDILWLNGE